MTQISHSRVEGYLLCERKTFYGYDLGLRRKSDSASLRMGTAGHACLEALYKTLLEKGKTQIGQRRAWKLGVAAMWAKYHELVVEGYQDTDTKRWTLKEVLEHYIELEPLIMRGYRVLAVEKEFHVRWNDDGDTMLFKVDLIARTPDGRDIVIDFKFVWDFYNSKTARLQPQLPKYVGMLRFLGFNVAEGMYVMLRTRRIMGDTMKKPDMLAALPPGAVVLMPGDDPRLSKPVEKWTVPELKEALESLGIQTSTGATPEQKLDTLPVVMSTVRIERTLREQFTVAERILARQSLSPEERDLLAVRTANNMVCKSCSFRDLCSAELAGDDTRIIMEDYEVRDDRELPELDGEDDA